MTVHPGISSTASGVREPDCGAMTAEQRRRQAMVKIRLISQREMRRFMAGEADCLPGNTDRRATLDAIRQAYLAGRRDGAK